MRILSLIMFLFFLIATILNWIVAIWKYPPYRWDCIILGIICYFIAMEFRKNFIMTGKNKR